MVVLILIVMIRCGFWMNQKTTGILISRIPPYHNVFAFLQLPLCIQGNVCTNIHSQFSGVKSVSFTSAVLTCIPRKCPISISLLLLDIEAIPAYSYVQGISMSCQFSTSELTVIFDELTFELSGDKERSRAMLEPDYFATNSTSNQLGK